VLVFTWRHSRSIFFHTQNLRRMIFISFFFHWPMAPILCILWFTLGFGVISRWISDGIQKAVDMESVYNTTGVDTWVTEWTNTVLNDYNAIQWTAKTTTQSFLTAAWFFLTLSIINTVWKKHYRSSYQRYVSREPRVHNEDTYVKYEGDFSFPILLMVSWTCWFVSNFISVFFAYGSSVPNYDFTQNNTLFGFDVQVPSFFRNIRALVGLISGLLQYGSIIPFVMNYIPSYIRINLDIYYQNKKQAVGAVTNLTCISFNLFAFYPAVIVLLYQVFGSWVVALALVLILYSPTIFWLHGSIDMHVLDNTFFFLYYTPFLFLLFYLIFSNAWLCPIAIENITPHLITTGIMSVFTSYLMWAVMLRIVLYKLFNLAQQATAEAVELK